MMNRASTPNGGEKEMNKMEYRQKCQKIFNHYGIVEQRKQLIQECAELIQAVTKLNTDNIIEEMADVQVMLDQFAFSLSKLNSQIDEVKFEKVQRQLKRIESEEG